MLCHSGRVAGATLLGAPSSSIDLETFFDDLLLMRDLAPMLGLPMLPVPFDLDGLTSAVGSHDAFGLGFRLVGPLAEGSNTNFGPQHAPAWWLLKYKDRIYVDGSGAASGHHSMMATLVAFGITPDQLAVREQDFLDVVHYIRSLQAPCWTLTELDAAKVARGQVVFDAHCAGCHGVHSGASAAYPNKVIARAEVGTDPVRAERFGDAEAARLNASWFGDPPFMPTGGYLAPPLAGVWARAPYFHNGSVPDLAGVIDPALRPSKWRRLGTELEHYDVERVGLRFEEVATPPDPNTRDGRLVYDTTREGMGNGGHLFGAVLSEEERSDLLEYLRSL
jgi:mono/diheme cytochrome c family protein